MKIRVTKYGLLSIVLFFLPGFTGFSKPLPQNNKYSIIIDTDCATDDFRAISYLLSIPEVTIKAVVTCDGSVAPDVGIEKVNALLHQFHADSIPLAIGKNKLSAMVPSWRHFASCISWGSKGIDSLVYAFHPLYDSLINTSQEKIILLCLGPLTNIAELIQNNHFNKDHIERIIWYNESINPSNGFNYSYDQEGADLVLSSGLRVDVISNLSYPESVFDTLFFQVVQNSNSIISTVFAQFFSQPPVYEKLIQNHFKLFDDLAALYLLEPELFDVMPVAANINLRMNTGYDLRAVKEALTDIITGQYHANKSIVFTQFPIDREYYSYDVRQVMDSIISLYGYDEWKSVVMTDEFHGHLGVYSIVGAKMGTRAKEYFGVGQDQLEVISYAGSKPPYSCMNDGIQVSTGATLGMGTIHLVTDSANAAKAVFKYGNHSIMLTLKPEYKQLIDSDINQGLVQYGLLDNGYWKLIRKNAIKYWLEWDRDEIFDILILNN